MQLREDRPSSGFLIVRRFAYLYRHFHKPIRSHRDVYAIPRCDRNAESAAKQYRGIDREALESWSAEDLDLGFPNIPMPTEREACLWMSNLKSPSVVSGGFIASHEDAVEAFRRLRSPRDWELIWASSIRCIHAAPDGFELLGYEPTWFWGDHFSAVCDSMCFPRWHGTDEAGEVFTEYFQLLNRAALFDSPDDARRFLEFYQSFDWTETGDYVIAQIRAPAEPVA